MEDTLRDAIAYRELMEIAKEVADSKEETAAWITFTIKRVIDESEDWMSSHNVKECEETLNS